MDAAERRATREGILEELRGLFQAAFAWEVWGRLLVHVAAGEDGAPFVVDVAVEDIVGDEARLSAAFEGPEVRASLPALARAVEALSALDGVELEAVGGGTFVRTEDGRLAFLPGLVRSPSPAFDRARDGVASRVREKNDLLAEQLGIGRDATLGPIEGGRLEISRGGQPVARARAVLLGTFSRATRTFVWAAANPSLDASARRAAADLLDAMPERSAWEISTFGFATDEPTAWALAGWVCDALGGDGVAAIDDPGGLVFVRLSEIEPTPAAG